MWINEVELREQEIECDCEFFLLMLEIKETKSVQNV